MVTIDTTRINWEPVLDEGRWYLTAEVEGLTADREIDWSCPDARHADAWISPASIVEAAEGCIEDLTWCDTCQATGEVPAQRYPDFFGSAPCPDCQ